MALLTKGKGKKRQTEVDLDAQFDLDSDERPVATRKNKKKEKGKRDGDDDGKKSKKLSRKTKVEAKTPAGPVIPAAGFDFLEGRGRRRRATQLLNRKVAVLAVVAVVASALFALQSRATQTSLQEEVAASNSAIEQLNADIVEASNSILSEEVLVTHRNARRDAILATAEQQLPYAEVINRVFALANDVGVNLTSIQLDGNSDNGLSIAGTAPSLEAIGNWSTALQTELGVFRPDGFVESVTNSYQAIPGDADQQFTSRVTPNTERMQLYIACVQIRPFMGDQPVGECNDVFFQFEGVDTNGDGEPDSGPTVNASDTDGDGVDDTFEYEQEPVIDPPQVFNDEPYTLPGTGDRL